MRSLFLGKILVCAFIISFYDQISNSYKIPSRVSAFTHFLFVCCILRDSSFHFFLHKTYTCSSDAYYQFCFNYSNPYEFLTSELVDFLSVESKRQKVSWTLLRILSELNDFVVWIVAIFLWVPAYSVFPNSVDRSKRINYNDYLRHSYVS